MITPGVVPGLPLMLSQSPPLEVAVLAVNASAALPLTVTWMSAGGELNC